MLSILAVIHVINIYKELASECAYAMKMRICSILHFFQLIVYSKKHKVFLQSVSE